MDLFCIRSCDLLRLQCQTAVTELILIQIGKNNAVFLPPEHGEGNRLGHAGVCATGVLCSQGRLQSRLCEDEAALAAPLVPGLPADAWAVSQLASAPWQKQSSSRHGNSHRPLAFPARPAPAGPPPHPAGLLTAGPGQNGAKRGKTGPSPPSPPTRRPPGFSGLLVVRRSVLPLLPLRGVLGGFPVPAVLPGRNGIFWCLIPASSRPAWLWVCGTREVLPEALEKGEEAAEFGGASPPGGPWTVLCLRELWQASTDNKVDNDASY